MPLLCFMKLMSKQYKGYTVFSDGRIGGKRINTLTAIKDMNGYFRVRLWYNSRYHNLSVHRLLAICFIPNLKNKPQVNHKNGIKTDNRLCNLEWVSHTENLRHASKNGKLSKAKANLELIKAIKKDKGKITVREIAEKHNVSQAIVYRAFK